jgi:hypothetical protein
MRSKLLAALLAKRLLRLLSPCAKVPLARFGSATSVTKPEKGLDDFARSLGAAAVAAGLWAAAMALRIF